MRRIVTTLTAFGIGLALVGCSDMSGSASSARMSLSSNAVAGPGAGASNADDNPTVPGATGQTIVPGDRSTIAGDEAATEMQRSGRV
jgi:hypothetical protein